jgi:hypothetical protein
LIILETTIPWPEDAFRAVLDGLKQHGGATVAVVQRKQGVQHILLRDTEEDAVSRLIDVADDVPVCQHHALFVSGCSAGVQDRRKVVFRAGNRRIGFVWGEGLPRWDSLRGRAQQADHRAFDLLDPGIVPIQMFQHVGVGEQERRFAEGAEGHHPVGVHVVVQRDDHPAGELDGKVRDGPGGGVLSVEDHPVPRFQSPFLQITADTEDPLVGFNIGEGLPVRRETGETSVGRVFFHRDQKQLCDGGPLAGEQLASICIKFVPDM